ncbi:MAG: DNA polymerase I [Candidatus Bipolaricaulis sp.]|nr:DNA polymerase I [Candidatus Bipolaricaulis sp.]MDD5645693.1 DNA polymerase I [Candidatus Bipolaricaulis sp.]
MPTYEEILRLPVPRDASRVLVFDGHSHVYRAYYAIRDLSTPDGRPINAVFGFWKAFLRAFRDYPSMYVAVVFDAEGPTFRHALYDEYKATRKPMPADLASQLPLVVDLLEILGVPVLSQQGVEADDVLASVARAAVGEGLRCLISTSDKDMAQVVSPEVSLLRPAGRAADVDAQLLDPDGVRLKYGVSPSQIVDLLALVGDSSDNVPGVPGVGEKTAVDLLHQFGSLDGILASLDELRNARIREKLRENTDRARRAQQLVRLRTDLPLPNVREACGLRGVDAIRLAKFFANIGFRSALDELRLTVQPSRPAAPRPTSAQPALDYRCILDAKELASAITALRATERFALDLETTSLDPMEAEIVGIAVSPAPFVGYYIPVGHNALGAPPQLPVDDVLEALRPLIDGDTPEIIGQNLKYDVTILERHGLHPRGISFDAMIADHLVRPEERRHNLDEIARNVLGYETVTYEQVAGKDGAFAAVSVDAATRYAAEDAEVVQRLFGPLRRGLEDVGATRLFETVEVPLVSVLSRMERNGILVDCSELATQGAEIRKELSIVESDLFDIAGAPFNPNSPKQVAELLFDRLGLPPLARTKTGPSTSAEVLAELAIQHPLPGKLLVHRELTKLLSTYIDQLPKAVNRRTGRIHTSFHQTSTATGRLSSSDPNLQNIPTRTEIGGRIRQAFVAPEGWVLVGADYSQIELRLLGHLSGDDHLRAAFEAAADLHRVTASRVFGIPEERVTSLQRDAAKRINFGILYGISPFGLAKELGTSQAEAKTYIDRFFTAYPKAHAYIEALIRRATEVGYAETLLGRRRPLRNLSSKDAARRNFDRRNAVNTPIQGSAADLIKLAMIDIDRRIAEERWPARMLLQIHDELVFEVEAGACPELSTEIGQAMKSVLALRVPLEVKVSVGRHWGEI